MSPDQERPRLFYGWVVVAACFLATLTLGETFWCFGVFFKPLESEFGWSRAVTSSAYTCFLIGHAISLVVGGRLGDRISPRPILLATAVISGTAIALCSQTDSVNELRLFLFIAGLGAGPMWSVSTSTVVRWFNGHKRASVALAVTTTGVGAGAIIFAPLINHFIGAYGWRDAFLYVGIIMAIIVLAAALLVRRAPQAGASDSSSFPARGGAPTRAMIGAFITVTFIITVAIFSFQAVNVHLVPHATDVGISDTSAAIAVGLTGAFSIPGRLISGFVSDAIGWRRTLALAVLGMALSITWLLFLDAVWMLYAFVLIYGTCHGIRVPAQIGILGQTFGLSSLGQLVGISTAIGQLVGATAPYVMGFIYDHTGGYATGFYILMAMLAATGIVAFMLRGRLTPGQRPTDR
ncbi:MAG: MFS transporter [Dehalococcoidia bacterium]|nr:MFS transporter [Dehalococcoidia bacterium]